MLAPLAVVIQLAALGHSLAPVHCRFHEANQLVHQWEGSCGRLFGQEPKIKLKPAKAIVSGQWRKDAEPTAVWAGSLIYDDSSTEIELELYAGGSGVLRTEDGWYAVSAFKEAGSQLTFELDTAREIAPNERRSRDRQASRRPPLIHSRVESRGQPAVPGIGHHLEHLLCNGAGRHRGHVRSAPPAASDAGRSRQSSTNAPRAATTRID